MIPICAKCGAPIVRGVWLPWTHANAYRGRGHYASPAPGTYVSPKRTDDNASWRGAAPGAMSPPAQPGPSTGGKPRSDFGSEREVTGDRRQPSANAAQTD